METSSLSLATVLTLHMGGTGISVSMGLLLERGLCA